MRKGAPGPVAKRAFRTGMIAAALLGLVGLAGGYWVGLSVTLVVYLAVVVFPVYLVLAAAVVNAWLGYGGDAIPLKPVGSGATDRPPGESATAEERRDRRVERRVRAAAETPRTHLALALGALALGLAAALAGYPAVAFFAWALAYLTTVIAIQAFLWPRLEAYFERRAARTPRRLPLAGAVLTAEFKAGLLVTLLIFLLLGLSVGLVTLLL